MTTKSPGGSDSNNVLTWKYAYNLWVTAVNAGHNPSEPKLGSSDNVLLSRALEAALTLQ